jgi:kynurenine formamidase
MSARLLMGVCVGVLAAGIGAWSEPGSATAAPAPGAAGTPEAGQAAAGEPVLGPGPSAARTPRDAEEFDALFRQVSNWGRWGKDDQLGTANLISEAKRRQAASLVQSGRAVGLAHSPIKEKAVDTASPFEHTMNKGFTTDTYRVSYHGYSHSHIDALCHIVYKDQIYNGHKVLEVNTEKGCTTLGIEGFRNGYVTRGILMDIPRLKGLPYLEPGTPIFIEDLEAWEKKARVKVAPGDALLIRTGRWARRDKLGPWNVAANAAGLHASVVTWLKARGVALIGSDAALDVVPDLVDDVILPVHTLVMVALGTNILDNQDLEPLGDLAARENRWAFMLTVAPVPVVGGTGFPVNALATF